MQLSLLIALLPLASAIPVAQTDACNPSTQTVTVTVTASSTTSTRTSTSATSAPSPCEFPEDSWLCWKNEPPQPSPTSATSTSTSTSAASAPTKSCTAGWFWCDPPGGYFGR